MRTLRRGSTGPYVELLQSILRKLNIYFGAIEGNFGPQTESAVKIFQKNNGLNADGIVGANTWNALMPYINGYITYTIEKGDTFYKIAQKYGTTVDALIFANPQSDYENLVIGEQITVPLSSIVPTNVSYTSELLNMNISSLKTVYPFLDISIIGTTVMGRNITAIKFGNGPKEIFYNASIHANEWINSVVIMKFLENLSKSYVNNVDIYGYNPRQLFNMVSLYIVPMINLDGVDLVTGLFSEDSWAYNNAKRISSNFPDIPFPNGWKANIEGVDLNLQFPADWEKAKEIKFEQGYTKPAPRDFVGFGPLTAPESVAIYNFTLAHNFELMITYHTQGRVIYYEYQGLEPNSSKEIANIFSKISGYFLEEVPYNSSFAGYKDWFILYYRRPGFTIETGIGENPLPISQFDSIYRENLGILITGLLQ